MLEHIKRV